MGRTRWSGMTFLSRWHLKGLIKNYIYVDFGKEEKEGIYCLVDIREKSEYVVGK